MSESLSLERASGNPADIGDDDLESLANLYARVFAAEPWNEYTQCLTNGAFFDTTTQPGEPCPDTLCDGTLRLAYPPEQTMEYIKKELSHDEAALWLLRDTSQKHEVVGFTWGFAYDTPETFACDKYKTPEMQAAISGLLHHFNIGTNGLWYLSESGIENDPRYRGKGWSREFHNQRLATARSIGFAAIQRTSAYGAMYRTSSRLMTQLMGIEMNIDDLEKELHPTGRLVNNLSDTEIEGRVLFTRPL